jgi:hypothetical protein
MVRLAAFLPLLVLALSAGCQIWDARFAGRDVDVLIKAGREDEAVLLADSLYVRARQGGSALRRIRAGLDLAYARRSAGDPAGAEELAQQMVQEAGAPDAALAYFAQAQRTVDGVLARSLGAVSESRQLGLRTSALETINLLVSFDLGSSRTSRSASEVAWQAVLSSKGRVFEVAADLWAAARRRATPEDGRLLEELRETRRKLAEAVYDLNSASQGTSERVMALEQQGARIEERLSDRLPLPQSSALRISQVASEIPEDALLVDLVRYTKKFPQLAKDEGSDEDRYAAYVLSRSGELRSRDLGPAKAIDRAVAKLREAMVRPDDPGFRVRARALDRKVFEPSRGSSRRRGTS